MKKIGLVLIAAALLLTACTKEEWTDYLVPDDRQALHTFEQIVSAIEAQDKTALKNLFSQNAQKEAEGLDESIDAFFSLFEGEEISFEQDVSILSEKEVDEGKKRKMLQAPYEINTDSQKFYAVVLEYVVDTFEPDNVGIECIYIIHADKWESTSIYRGDGKWIPGIHIDKVDEEDSEYSDVG